MQPQEMKVIETAYDKRSRREDPRRDSPPRPSSSSVIGEAEIREIAREVTKQSHEEVLQAIEKKLHITGDREGIRCTECMGNTLLMSAHIENLEHLLVLQGMPSIAIFVGDMAMTLIAVFSMLE